MADIHMQVSVILTYFRDLPHNFIFWPYKYQHMQQITCFCSVWDVLNKTVSFLHILTISDYTDHKRLMYQI